VTKQVLQNRIEPSTHGGFSRSDLGRVRDAANGFLVSYLWGQGDSDLNRPAVLASLRTLRREINLFVHAAGVSEVER